MKWFIIIVLAGISLGVGYLFSIRYKRRLSFFSALISLSEKLDVEINFSKERLKNLIENFDDKTKAKLLGLDKNFLVYLNNKENLTQELLFKNISVLKQGEKENIYLFFKNLGRTDCENQSKEIKNYLSKFAELKSLAEVENKKYGSVMFKLGIVGALFVLVIFI